METDTRLKKTVDWEILSTLGASAATSVTSNGSEDKGDKKRKATSPLYDADSVLEKTTRHNTGDDLRSHESLYHAVAFDIADEDNDGNEPPVHVLPQPLYPNDIIQIATSLRALMLPDLKLVVRESMKETTKSLQDDIKKFYEDVKSLENENQNLKKTDNDLVTCLAEDEYETDNLEQYSRRNSLRILGIVEDKDDNTDQQVIRITGQLGVDIGPNDIDRSHRVGKLEPDHSRSGRGPPRAKSHHRGILVKFSTYNA